VESSTNPEIDEGLTRTEILPFSCGGEEENELSQMANNVAAMKRAYKILAIFF